MKTFDNKKIFTIIGLILLIILIIGIGIVVWFELFYNSPKDVKEDEEIVKIIEPVITRSDDVYFENKKLVAITFDDGPSQNITTRLLDELDKRDAKVSFFVVGNRIEKQTELVKRIFNSGHTIGNHSYSHKSFNKQTPEEYLNEINTTNLLISNITGQEVTFVRPPYGSYKQSTLDNVNMTFVLWSIDTLDWKVKDADLVYNEIITKVKDGSVILMHDIYESTVDGALKAIDYLLDNGYAVVSLDEMYRLRKIEPMKHAVVRAFYIENTTNETIENQVVE